MRGEGEKGVVKFVCLLALLFFLPVIAQVLSHE